MPYVTSGLLHRLDARDRQLLLRWALRETCATRTRRLWLTVTHLGGTMASLALSLLPMLTTGRLHQAGALSLLVLTASHLLVQLVKRTVVRDRPAAEAYCLTRVTVPDHFSFPSGHAAAAMSVAFGYAAAFPEFGAFFISGAALVGASRIVLGVHYPGDVLVGQAIALLTGLAVIAP